MSPAETIIRQLNLIPHPEGGYYRETHRSTQTIPSAALLNDYDGERSVSTAIYYLITKDSFSALHRIRSDELFHFYGGDPVSMIQIHPNGQQDTFTLGCRIDQGDTPQVLVPQNTWQGLKLNPGGEYALLGCTVAPGFDFKDFQMGSRADLMEQFPMHRSVIREYTRT